MQIPQPVVDLCVKSRQIACALHRAVSVTDKRRVTRAYVRPGSGNERMTIRG